ncbi:MAG: M18 family aminopeptidase [bacterium]|nr:M18 family aminopeptidase [bacterium]
MNKITKRLLTTISESTSPMHCVEESKRQLDAAGYKELVLSEEWQLELGKGYYIDLYDSSFMAFRINRDFKLGQGFRFAHAHTDSPALRIKGNPEIVDGEYKKLNVEVYGGPILNTWFDRPLSIAGKVAVKSDDVFAPTIKLVDFKRPVITIPNLAIHLNRSVNSGVEINNQVDLLPLLGMSGEEMDTVTFMDALAKEAGVKKEDILDYELGIYCFEEGVMVGLNNEFVSAPRIDNISSVQACITALVNGTRAEGIDVIGCFDHEEVGSRSKKGADSHLLGMLLEKIYRTLGGSKMQYDNALLKSNCLSVDVAHALHPNKKEKSDITNKVYLNKGVAVKIASSQSYASDTAMVGMVVGICEKMNIPYQKFYNRSDVKGGSTLGAIVNAILPIPTQDIGIPLLAMHSSRETMGVKDQEYLESLLTAYFSL